MTNKRELKKQKKLQREQRQEKRTHEVLTKISMEMYGKPITMLSPRQIDMVLNKMLYNPDRKGRNFRQVR